MTEAHDQELDPRIRRTRLLLHKSLQNLLETRDFDKISVQDIADGATLNRATFYDHYPDKIALLQCTVAMQFQDLLAKRNINFDGTCLQGLKNMVLGVCDFIAATPGMNGAGTRKVDPNMESAVISVVRHMILSGLKDHPPPRAVPPEVFATTFSWAIYGAAKEWLSMPDRPPSEEMAGTIVSLLTPIF
jgi:AcrR family transcriptional regulator